MYRDELATTQELSELSRDIEEIRNQIRQIEEDKPYYLFVIDQGKRRYLGVFSLERNLKEFLNSCSYKVRQKDIPFTDVKYFDRIDLSYQFKKTSELSKYDVLYIDRYYIPEDMLYNPKVCLL